MQEETSCFPVIGVGYCRDELVGGTVSVMHWNGCLVRLDGVGNGGNEFLGSGVGLCRNLECILCDFLVCSMSISSHLSIK